MTNMYLNKAIIVGNITRNPEIKALPSGAKVTNFSVATNRTWKEKDGTKKEQTDFHNMLAFGKQAETIAQYCKKGDSILVEGRIQTRSWEDKDGKKRYRTEIVVDIFQFGKKASVEERVEPDTNDASQLQVEDTADEIDF